MIHHFMHQTLISISYSISLLTALRIGIFVRVHIKMLKMQTVCSSTFSGKNNKELTVSCVLLWSALFLFYTALRRNVACRTQCNQLRKSARFGGSFIGSGHYKTRFPSSQLVEGRQANFDTAVRRGQALHVYCVK